MILVSKKSKEHLLTESLGSLFGYLFKPFHFTLDTKTLVFFVKIINARFLKRIS
ncbi:hypothetical protein E0F76_05205 [Flavobacterium cellulosilyticum]|uniref:Uncharacterized protein n=1 Tax=Flavobacterium cellulosilyticum TaxID=2541731 RepID=A0A4R5CI81_9FLAO|nr:hypothetical protein E0F76_05205 [Flavobacterium cellulosilyticum]